MSKLSKEEANDLSGDRTMSSLISLRHSGGSSGSQQTVLQQSTKKKTKEDHKKNGALSRGIQLLWEQIVHAIRKLWDSMETKHAASVWEQSKGIIINLIQQNIPKNVFRAIVHVGGSLIGRLIKVVKNGIEMLHTRCGLRIPHHVVTEDDLQRIKDDFKDWWLEDDFPCAYQQLRRHFAM